MCDSSLDSESSDPRSIYFLTDPDGSSTITLIAQVSGYTFLSASLKRRSVIEYYFLSSVVICLSLSTYFFISFVIFLSSMALKIIPERSVSDFELITASL